MDWKNNNYFVNWLVADCFRLDILSYLSENFKQYCNKTNKKYDEESLSNVLAEFLTDLDYSISSYLEDEFDNEEVDDDE